MKTETFEKQFSEKFGIDSAAEGFNALFGSTSSEESSSEELDSSNDTEELDQDDTETSLEETTDQDDSEDEYLEDNSEDNSEDTTEDTDEETDTDDSGSKEETDEDVEDDFDYKAAYESIIGQSIKGGGKTFVPENMDEVRTLMEKGLGFDKAMSKLAPYRRHIKALESNGLTDESQLNLAIELMKGNKSAIAKLISQHKVDVHELDFDESNQYSPKSHVADKTDAAFTEAFDAIEESEHKNTLANALRDMDEESFQKVYSMPQAINALYSEIESGNYEKIVAIMNREDLLGNNISGTKPFLQRYYDTAIREASKSSDPTNAEPVKKTVKKRKPKPNPNKVAKGTQKSAKSSRKNLYGLSSEEFDKAYGTKQKNKDIRDIFGR